MSGLYNVVNYQRQEDSALVVGGKIVLVTGGMILPSTETQAAAYSERDGRRDHQWGRNRAVDLQQHPRGPAWGWNSGDVLTGASRFD